MLILGITALLCQQSSAAEDPTVEAIIRQNVDAMGGLYNWNQVESIQINGTVERDGQTVKICVIKKRPNLIRATVTIPDPNEPEKAIQIIRASDGRTAWTAMRLAGATEFKSIALSDEAASDLRVEAGILPMLIKFWQSAEELEFTGTEVFNGENAFIIEAKGNPNNTNHRFYISTDNFRTLGHQTIKSNETTTTTLSTYEKQDGIYFPKLSVINATKNGVSRVTTESIVIGVGIYDDYFKANVTAQTADQ
jgi:hypothetical protein